MIFASRILMKKSFARHSIHSVLQHWRTVLLLGILVHPVCAQEPENDFMENRWVTILSAYPDYADALKDIQKITKESGMPFSMQGLVYDKKRGLIYPDDYEFEAFAGGYVPRSRNEAEINEKITEYLSIERSDGYDGFRKGYYIVVAGIYESAEDAKKQSDRFKKWAPTAYSKRTNIYMGCMH